MVNLVLKSVPRKLSGGKKSHFNKCRCENSMTTYEMNEVEFLL